MHLYRMVPVISGTVARILGARQALFGKLSDSRLLKWRLASSTRASLVLGAHIRQMVTKRSSGVNLAHEGPSVQMASLAMRVIYSWLLIRTKAQLAASVLPAITIRLSVEYTATIVAT